MLFRFSGISFILCTNLYLLCSCFLRVFFHTVGSNTHNFSTVDDEQWRKMSFYCTALQYNRKYLFGYLREHATLFAFLISEWNDRCRKHRIRMKISMSPIAESGLCSGIYVRYVYHPREFINQNVVFLNNFTHHYFLTAPLDNVQKTLYHRQLFELTLNFY